MRERESDIPPLSLTTTPPQEGRKGKQKKNNVFRFPSLAIRSLFAPLLWVQFAVSGSKQPRSCVDAWGSTESRSERRSMAPKRTQASERARGGEPLGSERRAAAS